MVLMKNIIIVVWNYEKKKVLHTQDITVIDLQNTNQRNILNRPYCFGGYSLVTANVMPI
jgi:hypothetical protein